MVCVSRGRENQIRDEVDSSLCKGEDVEGKLSDGLNRVTVHSRDHRCCGDVHTHHQLTHSGCVFSSRRCDSPHRSMQYHHMISDFIHLRCSLIGIREREITTSNPSKRILSSAVGWSTTIVTFSICVEHCPNTSSTWWRKNRPQVSKSSMTSSDVTRFHWNGSDEDLQGVPLFLRRIFWSIWCRMAILSIEVNHDDLDFLSSSHPLSKLYFLEDSFLFLLDQIRRHLEQISLRRDKAPVTRFEVRVE